jgi:hypothetical protein
MQGFGMSLMNEEDATNLLISWLRQPDYGRFASYGYDIYLPNLCRIHYQSEFPQDQSGLDQKIEELMPALFAASWELCRKGILRPGVHSYHAQATTDGSAGAGYCITPFGHRWLQERGHDDFVPTEPGRFAAMLNEFGDRFGVGFHQRSQEAIRCYGAHAFLSCAVMCGAAAESVILATAIAKHGEEKVLSEYRAAGGRKKVENLTVGKASTHIQDEYRGYTTLLKYWRDESAHGTRSDIQDNEAYTSLAMLLRLCMFVNDNWVELTS